MQKRGHRGQDTRHRPPMSSAVDALASAPDFTAEEYVQSYLESRGYLRDNPSTGAREAHVLAFYILMSEQSPLLSRAGKTAMNLQSSLKNGSIPLNQILTDYEKFQQTLQEVDKAEQALAQICALFVNAALNPKDPRSGFNPWTLISSALAAVPDAKKGDAIVLAAGFKGFSKSKAWAEGAKVIYEQKTFFVPLQKAKDVTSALPEVAAITEAVDSANDVDLDW